jgi:membrane-bound ClpP family serine protease
MTLILLFFVVALVLLVLEVVTPGPFCGIAGGICLLAGVITAFAKFGTVGGIVAVVVAAVALAATYYAEFVWLPRSRLVKHLSMTATMEGTSQPPLAVAGEVVGREAVAQTVLGPTGYVQVDGRRYEAYCQNGHAEAGARLRVVGLDNFRLIVSKV